MNNTGEFRAAADALKKVSCKTTEFVNNITDELSFIECDRFVYSDSALGGAHGEGVVSGFASVDGINVALFANNSEVLKGSIGKRGADKIVKCVNNAVKMTLPLIAVFDTAGARFSEGIEALEGYGDIIKAFSNAYGNVPVICVVKGNNFGLTSYLTGICDCCIAYETACTATSSPLVLAAKSDVNIKSIGGVEAHAKKSGVYSAVVKNDTEFKNVLSSVLRLLCEPYVESDDDANRSSQILDCGVKVRTLIKETFDLKSFVEFRRDFATVAITGFARLDGIAVGVVATDFEVNEGRLNAASCSKISQFLNTCLSHNIPVINLVNSNGTVVSVSEDNGTLIKEVSDLMFLFNEMKQAKMSLIFGNAIGTAYVLFAGKAIVDYTVAWPCAQIGMVENLTAAELLYSKETDKAGNKAATVEALAKSYGEENTNAVTVSKFGYLDNVIEPEFTRQYLISALRILMNKG